MTQKCNSTIPYKQTKSMVSPLLSPPSVSPLFFSFLFSLLFSSLLMYSLPVLYLDNTFCNPKFNFPAQSSVIHGIADLVQKEVNGSERKREKAERKRDRGVAER